MKIKQIINGEWVYRDTTNSLIIGDSVEFVCNGRGRGGHNMASGTVTRVNKVTFSVVEGANSYRPGTSWNLRNDMGSLYLRK